MFWTDSVSGNALGTYIYLWTQWSGIGCEAETFFGTGNLRVCTWRETCDIVGFRVKTGVTVMGFLVALPGSYAILTSIILILSLIPVMVQLGVWFEGWEECMLLTD